jgi:hypothetical protein
MKQANNLGAMLLASGAVTGPYRRTKPLPVSAARRVWRAVRAYIRNMTKEIL